ncbi:DUF6750 family protein [Pseudomonas siliginis]|uniref:DUF6750 family protein n=1 Tax=Pseudomonas siliginis TaxID=2842346 RepID=UPI002093E8A8|nr:DUF6750 family protein [Pseudomonas siliginis]UST77154.1 hypothetical protein NF676_00370 [Pseudomonas siliginis]
MKFNPMEVAADLSRKAHIKLLAATDKCAVDPAQRRIMLSTAAVTFGALTFCAGASADGDGFAGMLSTAGDQADSGSNSVAKILKFCGLCAAAAGGFNWWKKGKEGERSDVKATQIFVPIIAGAVLGGIGYVLGKGGETVGISTSTWGQVPN